jgi:hypothetical protein
MGDYLRGAFVAYDPGAYKSPTIERRLIPFRFNPEGLSRSISIEVAPGSEGVEGSTTAKKSKTEQAADASSGTLKETFNVTIRLDFVDLLEASPNLDQELGILPEIAALEDLLYAVAPATTASSDGKEPVQPRAARPTVLFVWGEQRIYPVRITQMTVNETLHNASLNPIRAEVEVGLEVLRDGDARGNQAVGDALNYTGQKRRANAQIAKNRTSIQNTNVPDLEHR